MPTSALNKQGARCKGRCRSIVADLLKAAVLVQVMTHYSCLEPMTLGGAAPDPGCNREAFEGAALLGLLPIEPPVPQAPAPL